MRLSNFHPLLRSEVYYESSVAFYNIEQIFSLLIQVVMVDIILRSVSLAH